MCKVTFQSFPPPHFIFNMAPYASAVIHKNILVPKVYNFYLFIVSPGRADVYINGVAEPL